MARAMLLRPLRKPWERRWCLGPTQGAPGALGGGISQDQDGEAAGTERKPLLRGVTASQKCRTRMEDGYHGDSWQTGHTSARRPRSAPAGARQVAGVSLRGVIAGLFRSVIFLPSPVTPSNCEENTERIPQRAPPGGPPSPPAAVEVIGSEGSP